MGGLLQMLKEQDQVSNANFAFILINCLISRGCQGGLIGQGGPGGPGGPAVFCLIRIRKND